MHRGSGISFWDLYEREGLLRVARAFCGVREGAAKPLHDRLVSSRANPPEKKAESDLLVALAPHFEDFIARLFGIEVEARALAGKHNQLAPICSVKRLFVQRRALHKVKSEDAKPDGFDFSSELEFARQVTEWLKDEATNAKQLELAARYAAWAVTTPEGRSKHRTGVLFKTPRKLDFMRLIPVHTGKKAGFPENTLAHLRHRGGFQLTDPGTGLGGAVGEAK